MKLFTKICVGLFWLPAAIAWSQVDNTPTAPVPALLVRPESASDQMQTPPPVSGQSYPTTGTFGGALKLSARRTGIHHCLLG